MTNEQPELPEGEEHEEAPGMGTGAAVAAFLAGLCGLGIVIYLGVAQTLAGLFVVVGIPLILLWFVWHVFLRRLWRVRRIRGAQERRELMEAALRDKEPTTKETGGHEV